MICTAGVTFLLLSCVLPNSYWSMFILLFYIFLIIPLSIITNSNEYNSNTNLNELAIFIAAILFVSTFGFLIVVYLKGYLQGLSLSFALIGNVIFIITIGIYAILFHKKTDDFI
ncbi:hypothetical protein I4U23_006921 [Adineta vaga]|nr:hypothetical protein I4U23_006921 [Adineta vaga]